MRDEVQRGSQLPDQPNNGCGLLNKMTKKEKSPRPLILVVEDVHETRDGIEKLLQSDGYRVGVARDERDAVDSAQRQPPDLILVSLAGSLGEVIFIARRIREHAGIGDRIPVVAFCIEEIREGEEVALGQNVHVTRPDNFNQLRSLLIRLLNRIPVAA
jgi:CheY-like chemotaxis protein